MKALVNVNIVTENGILEDGVLLVENGKIVGISKRSETSIPVRSELLDCDGLIAGPGLVDIHCHGGGKSWCYEDPIKAAQYHLLGGTTSLCCSLYHAQDYYTTLQAIELIRNAYENNMPGNIVGIHFEGPYLNPKYGASAKTARKPDPNEYNAYLKYAKDLIRQWSFSPEVENIEPFVNEVLSNGIPLAFAHSEASAELVFKYAQKGVSICTHLMNATGLSIKPSRWEGTREVGFDEAVMLCKNVMVEIIPDKFGVHVRPEMCRLILQTVGLDRVVVITDCTATNNNYSEADESIQKTDSDSEDINMINGELYGSRLIMSRAVQNYMRHTKINIVDAFRVGSLNPARAIRMQNQIGSLAVGKKANIIIVDESFNLKTVFLNGALVVTR